MRTKKQQTDQNFVSFLGKIQQVYYETPNNCERDSNISDKGNIKSVYKISAF